MKVANLKKAVLRVVSFLTILSFIFSGTSFSLPDTNLRTMSPSETKTAGGLRADLTSAVLQYFVGGQEVDFTKWEYVPGTDNTQIRQIGNPSVVAKRQPDGKFAVFSGGLPAQFTLNYSINEQVKKAVSYYRVFESKRDNPAKAAKLLEKAIAEYEDLIKELAIDSGLYKLAQDELHIAELWLYAVKITILSRKDVKKWDAADFYLVEKALKIKDPHVPSELTYLEGIPDILYEYIFHLNLNQLKKYTTSSKFDVKYFFNVVWAFNTLTLIIQNPEKRELISVTKREDLKKELSYLLQSADEDEHNIGSEILSRIKATLAAIGPEPGVKYSLSEETAKNLQTISSILRKDILEMLFKAGSGHPGGSLSAAEILSTLYFSGILNHDPNDPKWENRDRVVVSAGHKAPVVYAALAEAGYFSKAEFDNLRKNPEAMLQGHIDMKKTPGVDWSTGALGQGFSAACGMAAAARLQGKNLHTWCVLGGGEEQEGQISEAARHTAALGLTGITAIIDDNGYQIEGEGTDVDKADVAKVWEGYGWNVITVDGHSVSQLYDAMQQAKNNKDEPTLIIAKTQKGKGVKYFEDNPTESHGSVPKDEAIRKQALEDVKKGLGDYSSAEIEDFISFKQLTGNRRSIIDKESGKPEIAKPAEVTLKELKPGDKVATRAAFGEMMNYLGNINPNLVAMSADLQPSAQLVKFEDLFSLMSSKNQQGRYVALGIREAHGPSFAAGMSSMGIIPVVHTFDMFSLNQLPQIRMMAQAGVPVVFAFSHTGVAVGEDGLTHQSAETQLIMDAISGPLGDKLDIYDPADAQETRIVLEAAIKAGKPVYLRLTRQDVPILDKTVVPNYEQKVAEGSYILRDPGNGKNDLIIVATGATVAEAFKASEEMEKESGLKVKVINVVSLNKIDNPGNPFQTYLENGTPIITVCDGYAKCLESPVLRATNEAAKNGLTAGLVYARGLTTLGSGTPKELYALNGLDAAGIKKSTMKVAFQVGALISPLHMYGIIGQHIWVDGVTWEMLQSGKFEELVKFHAITGVTTNPPLIKAYLKDQKVLAKAKELAQKGLSQEQVYYELIKDLALTVREIFKKCQVNGKFSVELDPTKVTDIKASVEEAMKWTDIDPEFIMVKVCLTPGSDAGYKIIEEVTARGRNVNATVIMSPGQYQKVTEAYINGLEKAAARDHDLSKIFSVASFFISRWDVKLAQKLTKELPEDYRGMLANSVAIWSYNKIFLRVFNSSRFRALEVKGARKQLFLLASTGSKADKMPESIRDKYPPDVYVTPIQGRDIVNTLPVATIDYLIDEGTVEPKETIKSNLPKAEGIIESLGRNNIYIEEAGEELLQEGLDAFVKDFTDIQKTIGDIVKANRPTRGAGYTAVPKEASDAEKAEALIKIQAINNVVDKEIMSDSAALNQILGEFSISRQERTGLVVSIDAVAEGLGAVLVGLANRGTPIYVVTKKDNEAHQKLVLKLNEKLTVNNKIQTAYSFAEAASNITYEKQLNRADKITFVVATEEEAKRVPKGKRDVVIIAKNIIEALGNIENMKDMLEDFRKACSQLGIRA